MTRRRPGSTLLELLVAMPLALLLGALAVQLFVSQLRISREVGAHVQNHRDLEHSVIMLAADLRSASATDLESWSDTSFVVQTAVLHAIVCGTPAPNVVDVITGLATHPLRAVTLGTPRAGDILQFALSDTTLAGLSVRALDSLEQRHQITSIASEPSACATSVGNVAAGGTPLRFTLGTTPPRPPALGTPITATRRVEWRAYRASDNAYYLGRREWDGGNWNTVQPAIGPLLANSDLGFRVQVLRENGSIVAAPANDARAVQMHFRMPRQGAVQTPSRFDSLTAVLALRGGR